MGKLTPKDRINNLLSQNLNDQLLPLRKELEECRAKNVTILDEYANVKAAIQSELEAARKELESVRRELELIKGELEAEKAVNDTLRANAKAMSEELKKGQGQAGGKMTGPATSSKEEKKPK